MDAAEFSYLLGMGGTVAFAVTAVLAVTPRGIDLFGASVLGVITAIGGGTIRDLILDVPVFWASDLNYIWVALASSVVAFYWPRFMSRADVYSLMLYLDAIGLSMFAIQASRKVLLLEFALPLGPILLGVITAIGGGLLRDVLAGNPTLLMKRELYAIPVTIGCALYVVAMAWMPSAWTGLVCALVIFSIRAAAIRWGLTVPEWMLTRAKEG